MNTVTFTLESIYLTTETFEKALDDNLTILSYPSKKKQFYTCEYLPLIGAKNKVRVYVY